MTIRNGIFGINSQSLCGGTSQLSRINQVYFLYHGNANRTDVYGTKGAMAYLCLEIISNYPELSDCRIGRYAAKPVDLLTEKEIILAAAEYVKNLSKRCLLETVKLCQSNAATRRKRSFH